MTEPPNLDEIHDFLIGLAHKAGVMIISAHPSSAAAVGTKVNSSDLVTETDKAVEDMVSTALKAEYPDYIFLGEESSTASSRLTPAPTFIVDPIDGTTNFVHAFPYVSISLAFAQELKSLVGVVYNPFTQKLYTAIRGKGAFLTSPNIPTSFPYPSTSSSAESQKIQGAEYSTRSLPLRSPAAPLDGLRKALVAVEWGNERSGHNWDVKTGSFSALAGEKGAMVHSLRSLGSAALNMCGVASGELDAYWEGGCWPWDVAAGWVIVEEAGGLVVGGNKGEWEGKVDARRYLVVRGGEGGRELVEEFWSQLAGEVKY